eukprot:COSAG06_NODE_11139_length_1559_cov_1.429452_1_plen_173_part_10
MSLALSSSCPFFPLSLSSRCLDHIYWKIFLQTYLEKASTALRERVRVRESSQQCPFGGRSRLPDCCGCWPTLVVCGADPSFIAALCRVVWTRRGLAKIVGVVRYQPNKDWAQGDEGRLLRAADHLLKGATTPPNHAHPPIRMQRVELRAAASPHSAAIHQLTTCCCIYIYVRV